MRFFHLTLLLAIAVGARAQMSAIGLTSKTMLVNLPEVKKELDLTKQQDQAIQQMLRDAQANPTSAGMSIDMVYMTRAFDQKVAQALGAEQQKRLQELFCQANGPLALYDPATADELGLTDAQKTAVKEIAKEWNSKKMSLLMNVQKTHKVDWKAADAVDKEYGDKVETLLDKPAQDKWAKMQGQPFVFKSLKRDRGR